MKRMKIYTVLAITALFVLTACGGGAGAKTGGDKNSPSKIEMSMWDEMKKGNYEKGLGMWFDNVQTKGEMTAEEKAQTQEMIKALAEKGKEELDKKGGIKDVEVVSEDVAEDGQSATVNLKVTYGDGTVETPASNYVLEDGKWKINSGK